MKNKLPSDAKIAFFGTSEFAVYVFDELKNAGIEPIVLITPPDKPAGRGLALSEPPAKTWAVEHDIAVMQPSSLSRNDREMGIIYNSEWDLFIVASYGKLLPLDLLKLAYGGTLNVHPSLLPKFRGPSPIESQILSDERETGVTVMLLDEEMDHGPIIAQASIEPEEWPIKRSLLEELLGREGGKLLAEIIPTWLAEQHLDSETALEEGATPTLIPVPQAHEQATFTKKIEKSDGLIDLTGDPYKNFLAYSAFDVWPGTYFMHKTHGKEMRVKITEANYTDGVFAINKVIPEGKKEMDYESFLRGYAN